MSNNDEASKQTNKAPASVPLSVRSSTLQSLIRAGSTAALPTSSRSGSSGFPVLARPNVSSAAGPKAKAKSRVSFAFAPNVSKTCQQPSKTDSAVATSSQPSVLSQNVLAHRLAMMEQGPTNRKRVHLGPKVVSANFQQKLAQADIRRRKSGSKKSREILELSWAPEDQGTDVSLYTPISLPYVLREEDLDIQPTAPKATDAQRKTRRPTLKTVDEANANAEHLFKNSADDEDMTNWMLVQWPSLLPALDRDAIEADKEARETALLDEEERAERNAEKAKAAMKRNTGRSDILEGRNTQANYQAASFSSMPEGFLGQIRIRQSGRVELVIDNHVFDVNSGSDCNFNQEVGIYLEGNDEFFFMGRCLKRMMVTPNIAAMIQARKQTNDDF